MLHEDKAAALFLEQFADTVWEPETALVVDPRLSTEDRLPVLFSAYSFASEQFRLLATRLQQLQEGRAFKSVLVTSTVEGDGKSLLALNLALSLALGDQQKVLVVDADLRKGGLSATVKLDDRAGVKDWFQANGAIADFLYKVAGRNLWVLPAGKAALDPIELLKSPRTSHVLALLNGTFDWVLVDSPALLPLADAEVLSHLCDGTVIVVRRDRSPKAALAQAVQRVPSSKLIGLLLNDFPAVTHAK